MNLESIFLEFLVNNNIYISTLKGMMGNTHNSVLGSHATTGGVSGIVGKLLIIDSRNGD